MTTGNILYDRQVALLWRTAFGVSMTMTALKALTRHDEAREQMQKRYSQASSTPQASR